MGLNNLKNMRLKRGLRPLIKELLNEAFTANSADIASPSSPRVAGKNLPYDLDAPATILTLDMARQIGKYIDVDFDKIAVEDLYKGMKIETEHKDLDPSPDEPQSFRDWVMYAKIAAAHLRESPKYYEGLAKMEKDLNIKENVSHVEKYINKLSPKRKKYAEDYYHFQIGSLKNEPNSSNYQIDKSEISNIEKNINKLIVKENKMNTDKKLRFAIRNMIKEVLSETPQKNYKVYLKPGEKAPEGAKTSKGPKGGSYYYTVGANGPKHIENKKQKDIKPSASDKYFDDVHKRGQELEKNKIKLQTDDNGIHSVEYNGSKYWSKPGESEKSFVKRTKENIKFDHKNDVEIN